MKFVGLTSKMWQELFVIETKPETEKITYRLFFQQKIDLMKFKQKELKNFAKIKKLAVSGNKKKLVERIILFFKKEQKCVLIQKCVRGYFVRLALSPKLRGEGYGNTQKCLNDCDFFSFTPLSEIRNEMFYSYTDQKKFTYGFEIISLLKMFEKEKNMFNPYNREIINSKQIQEIFKLASLIKICFGNLIEKENQRTFHFFLNHYDKIFKEDDDDDEDEENNDEDEDDDEDDEQEIQQNFNELYDFMNGLTTYDNYQRIIGLFFSINSCRNYIQHLFVEEQPFDFHWFYNLNKEGYYNFYFFLYKAWRGVPVIHQNSICPILERFQNFEQICLNEISLEEIQRICITVFEHFFWTGTTDPKRQLGLTLCLMVLTIVSEEAKTQLRWLYENITINFLNEFFSNSDATNIYFSVLSQ